VRASREAVDGVRHGRDVDSSAAKARMGSEGVVDLAGSFAEVCSSSGRMAGGTTRSENCGAARLAMAALSLLTENSHQTPSFPGSLGELRPGPWLAIAGATTGNDNAQAVASRGSRSKLAARQRPGREFPFGLRGSRAGRRIIFGNAQPGSMPN